LRGGQEGFDLESDGLGWSHRNGPPLRLHTSCSEPVGWVVGEPGAEHYARVLDGYASDLDFI
jgi:hypothetical protein